MSEVFESTKYSSVNMVQSRERWQSCDRSQVYLLCMKRKQTEAGDEGKKESVVH